MNVANVATEVQSAILAQRKPAVAAVDCELADGQVERVALGSGRYRARDAGASAEALGAVAVRLLSKDGTVLRAMRLMKAEAPLAPAPAPVIVTESETERAMRLIGDIYDRAYRQAAEVMAAQATATREERELSWRGVGRALEVMSTTIDRAAEQLADLSQRERDASAREVEAAESAAEAASAGGTAGAVATVLRELPAAAPAIAQLAAMAGK